MVGLTNTGGRISGDEKRCYKGISHPIFLAFRVLILSLFRTMVKHISVPKLVIVNECSIECSF